MTEFIYPVQSAATFVRGTSQQMGRARKNARLVKEVVRN